MIILYKIIKRWLYTVNAKDIGTLYLFFGASAGVIGVFYFMLIWVELAQLGSNLFLGNLQSFNIVITVHVFVMIFFMLILGFIFGFGNWFISIMAWIGAGIGILFGFYWNALTELLRCLGWWLRFCCCLVLNVFVRICGFGLRFISILTIRRQNAHKVQPLLQSNCFGLLFVFNLCKICPNFDSTTGDCFFGSMGFFIFCACMFIVFLINYFIWTRYIVPFILRKYKVEVEREYLPEFDVVYAMLSILWFIACEVVLGFFVVEFFGVGWLGVLYFANQSHPFILYVSIFLFVFAFCVLVINTDFTFVRFLMFFLGFLLIAYSIWCAQGFSTNISDIFHNWIFGLSQGSAIDHTGFGNWPNIEGNMNWFRNYRNLALDSASNINRVQPTSLNKLGLFLFLLAGVSLVCIACWQALSISRFIMLVMCSVGLLSHLLFISMFQYVNRFQLFSCFFVKWMYWCNLYLVFFLLILCFCWLLWFVYIVWSGASTMSRFYAKIVLFLVVYFILWFICTLVWF